MNWKNLLVFILMFGIGHSFYQLSDLSNFERPFTKKSTTIYDKKYEKLLKIQKRFAANSPQGLQIAEQIKKMKRLINGYVKSDQPDEFVRILNEMKIPYGESYSSYPSNYRNIELEKSKRFSLNKISSTPLPWI